MLAEAYTGVSTQCAASVALSHADATTSALMQLADLSDEGLGKLKPTARLSPKRKRALILVSDSSTALCKTNSRGAFTKSDLDQEVRWTAFTLGLSEVRYSMSWGKTLAWIQWQVGEHVKELSCDPRLPHRYHRAVARQRNLRTTGMHSNENCSWTCLPGPQ